MENKTKKKSGMYWHCHHDKLCEYVWDEQERINFIKKNKPENEIETRLRLFKKVKEKLPKDLKERGEKYYEARKKCDEAREKYKKDLEELHKKECGCSEWNGRILIFKEIEDDNIP